MKIAAALVFLLIGCQSESIQTYHVPKETASPPDVRDICWETPLTWSQQPSGGMRRGSFLALGQDGRRADISVVPLSGVAGGVAGNVNRWRDQLGLPPAPPVDVQKHIVHDQLGQHDVLLVELSNPMSEAEENSIIAAIIEQPKEMWFFKMMGPADVTSGQRETFLDFIKSVRFGCP